MYAAPTPNVQRAILPLFLTNVDVEKELELVSISLMSRQQQSPNYKAKHPFGVVPYFEDGDIGIFESRAIAKYIVDKYEMTDLVGKTLKERAAVNQWVESEAQNFHAAVGPVNRELFLSRVMKKPVDEKLVAAGLESLGKVLDVYEAQLSKSKFLALDTYTLADAFHTPYLDKVRTMDAFKGVFDNRPHVKAWADALCTHPAFIKTTQMNWDAATPF